MDSKTQGKGGAQDAGRNSLHELLADLVRAYEREVNPATDWKDTALTKEEFDDATTEYRAAKAWLSANDQDQRSDFTVALQQEYHHIMVSLGRACRKSNGDLTAPDVVTLMAKAAALDDVCKLWGVNPNAKLSESGGDKPTT